MLDFEILRKYFPTKESVGAEIINLRAILELPKGTEHFLSDLHGENETLNHLLRNASGVVKQKIIEAFGDELSEKERMHLATLIYYPVERLKIVKKSQADLCGWYKQTLTRLTEIARATSSKYTRSKVRKALPKTYAYILDELIHIPTHMENKEDYYSNIIASIIELGQADNLITELCILIQRLAIDRLHIVGDIFDRGRGADKIIDRLKGYHSLDIQWGNHDILWMGAFWGNLACICNVIRINSKYNNLHILENAYGINLRPLYAYASNRYSNDDCAQFKVVENAPYEDTKLLSKMHKAITILQFKVEEGFIKRHPEYGMDGRLGLLEKLGVDSAIDSEELNILQGLANSFKESARLKDHINFLVNKGSLYKIFNGNLLMHGCVPTNVDGEFTKVTVMGEIYSGKSLYDKLDSVIRCASTNQDCNDYMWYLWCGKNSPVYGRNVMATFEEYFDTDNFTEIKNHYYNYIQEEWYCDKVIVEFGLNEKTAHVINGHMPVKVKSGESPVNGGGKHITIDGGMSKAYQQKTGIAGYTLISNSHGLILVSHAPFSSKQDAVDNMSDLQSSSTMIERYSRRVYVKDTDVGESIKAQIKTLTKMYKEYYN